MTDNNVDNKEYLIKIFEINQQILDVLQGLVHTLSLDKPRPPISEEAKNKNIEKINRLSVREKDIIKLIVDGKLNKQIADEVSLSLSTVEYHRSNIMTKLECNNICQLVKLYLQWEGSI